MDIRYVLHMFYNLIIFVFTLNGVLMGYNKCNAGKR